GFLAETKDKELACTNYNASVLTSIKDVTAEVLSAVNDSMTVDARARAIDEKSRKIEKDAKGTSENTCRVSDAYNGGKYFLYTFEVIRDVRMVYAPPTSIGVYGGETDNWEWPRHTGDFAIMRAYVAPDGKHAKYSKDNVPYHPKSFLPISTAPKKEGDFSMVMGFPGQTFRYRTASEIKLAYEVTLPMTVELFQKRIDIINAAGKNDRGLEIKYAAKVRNVANYYKKYKGTMDGMRRLNLLNLRQDQEAAFNAFLDSKPELKLQYGKVLPDIATAMQDLNSFNKKQLVLSQMSQAVEMVRLANRLKGFANAFKKDSASGKMVPGSSPDELRSYLADSYKDIDIRVDKELFKAFVTEGADLPEAQQIKAIKAIVKDKTGADREKVIRDFADDIYGDSHLTDTAKAAKMASESADDIRDDRFVKFVIALDEDFMPLIDHVNKYNSNIVRLRGQWLKAYMAWKGEDIYPDANSTMRFTYGTVKSFNPRDAVHYGFITSVAGIMEKETGEGEFIVPPKERQIWEKKDFGAYADPVLNDVPVAYITDNDITGGNSGSPVINGNGELVGVAFDGNWEAVVDDYLF
ncbi:MAG TPA: S46 family peptidase, partial [Bacteroidota bacterium]|nr:S46 family peptidase [Bacteroidota bacterium]